MTTTEGGFTVGDRILERYELVRYIDRGAMGIVWEARDLILDRVVALKHVSFATAPDAEATRRRTLREARYAAKLGQHPHVIAIYDVQEVDGDVWLVLEYLPSRSLAQLTAGGHILDVAEAARVGACVALALAAAHRLGLIHCDVKPANVLLSLDGREVKLTDFGISQLRGDPSASVLDAVAGTPAYMAPEVARGAPPTSASDMFSLGATLYKATEGQPPFGDQDTALAVLQRVARELPNPPRRSGRFGDLLMHFLELDPSTRPDAPGAHRLLDDFARRLHEPTHPPTVRASPRSIHPNPDDAVGNDDADHDNGGRRKRSRRRPVLIATAAVVVAGLLLATLLIATRTDPAAIPPLPASVAAVTLAGDPRAADPCALLDETVMGRFGVVKVGPGGNIGECRLTHRTPVGGTVITDVHFGDTDSESVRGPVQSLGGVTVARPGIGAQGCTSQIVLADGRLIGIDSRSTGTRVETNICEVNEAALAVAVDRLDADGITYRPGWQGDVTLAGENACDIVGDSAGQVPGVLAAQQVGFLNGSTCYVGANRQGSPLVGVTLGLEPRGQMGSYGTPTQIQGKPAYQRAVTGYRNPTACRVSLVHRPSYDGGATRPTEYIMVQVEGTQPYEQLCQQGGAIAATAEQRAST